MMKGNGLRGKHVSAETVRGAYKKMGKIWTYHDTNINTHRIHETGIFA